MSESNEPTSQSNAGAAEGSRPPHEAATAGNGRATPSIKLAWKAKKRTEKEMGFKHPANATSATIVKDCWNAATIRAEWQRQGLVLMQNLTI
jgi:hypothetical protein